MNRRSVALGLSLSLLFSVASCGGDGEASTSPGAGGGAAKTPAEAAAKTPAAKTPAENPPASAQSSGGEVKLEHSAVAGLFGPQPVAPKVNNRLTKDKIALGKKLYHETKLSQNNDVSCATCHPLDHYGQDGKKTSPGTGGAAGARNTPTTFNASRQFRQFWDYRADTVEQQSTMPMTTSNEHGLADEAEIVAKLSESPEYVAEFKKAFPKDDAITIENVQFAIGAFERKLDTRSRFDDYIDNKDESALTAVEKKGLKTFMEVGCTTCHTSRLVGGQMVQKLGLIVPVETKDKGRFEVTGNPGDSYFFKVPQLLNVEKTAPYMHDGSIATLEEATRYMAKHQTTNTVLTDDQVNSIVAFLKALTGEPPAAAK